MTRGLGIGISVVVWLVCASAHCSWAGMCQKHDNCSNKGAYWLTDGMTRFSHVSPSIKLASGSPSSLETALSIAVLNWRNATGMQIHVVSSDAIADIEVRPVFSNYQPTHGGIAEVLDEQTGRVMYLNLEDYTWSDVCPVPGGFQSSYTHNVSILVHEIGHALGLDHYDDYDFLSGCPPSLGDDGPESCTVMTHCWGGECAETPLSLDVLGIKCLYNIVDGGSTYWWYIKGLYGPSCVRPRFSNLLALSSAQHTLVWSAAAAGTAEVMIFRGEAGEELELFAVNEPMDTLYVDTTAGANTEYSYLVATTNGDTLLDLGSVRAGLQRVHKNSNVNYQLHNMQSFGNSLYALEAETVRKFDISDPASPVEVDGENPNYVTSLDDLAISDDGETLFATSVDDRLVIIGASPFTTLVYFDLGPSTYPFYDMVAHGDFALVASGVGLYAVGLIPTTGQWGVCGTYGSGSAILGVERVGDYLYIARWVGGTLRSEIVRVTPNPSGTCGFTLECSSDLACWPAGVVFLEGGVSGAPHDGFALAKRTDGTLVVLDATDPVHPVIRKEIDVIAGSTPFPIKAYAFDDRFLYLLTSMHGFWLERGLHAYDLHTLDSSPVYATGGSAGVSSGHGFTSRGRYLYLSDTFQTQPEVPGNGDTRLSVFQKAYVSADLSTAVRPAGGGETIAGASAVMCPQGDGDQIVVEVAVDASFVTQPPSATTLSVSSPMTGAVAFASAVTYADSTPTLSSGEYRTTVTLTAGWGCGEDSIGVYWGGTLLGYQPIRVKSPDINTSGLSSGIVNLVDLAAYMTHHLSSKCNCVHPKLYDECFDFAYPDTAVGLTDFGFYGGHHGHYAGGGSLLSTVGAQPSGGRVSLTFSEEVPAIGPRTLRAGVRLDGVEPFLVMFLRLTNGSQSYDLGRWQPAANNDYQSFGTEIVRDGSRDLIVGVASTKSAIATSIDLGYFEFVATAAEPSYDAEDFTLVVADLLDVQNTPRSVAPSNLGRQTSAMQYRDDLAQNYPNPFNPSTTIAFSLSRATPVDLVIYDVTGARVRTLWDGPKAAGVHRIAWDGTDQRGTRVASGVYFYKLKSSHYQSTKKMVLLR